MVDLVGMGTGGHGGKVVVLGAGYAGLVASCYLRKAGYDVRVVEKLDTPGGRNRQFTHEGFTFEMGPSWLWMKEVHEGFYKDMGYKMEDCCGEWKLLDPGYRIYFKDGPVDVPFGRKPFCDMVEQLEPGAGAKANEFLELDRWRFNKSLAILEKPSVSLLEYALDPKLVLNAPFLGIFQNQKDAVGKIFKSEKVRRILEWPVIFVGNSPAKVPTLYSLLNYTAIDQGTWMPKGGMYATITGIFRVAQDLGVKFEFGKEVMECDPNPDGMRALITTEGERIEANKFVIACDAAFFDRTVTPKGYKTNTAEYWDTRDVSPAVMLYYVGISKELKNVPFHNLFFDADLYEHMDCIYGESPRFTENPLFYMSVASRCHCDFAPEGCDALYFLVPTPHKPMTHRENDRLFDHIIARVEQHTGESLKSAILFRKEFGFKEFCRVYHSLSGNAFGISNTLFQTGPGKPGMRSKTMRNVYFAGQSCHPGGGVPPSMISGRVVARLICQEDNMGPIGRLLHEGAMSLTQSFRARL